MISEDSLDTAFLKLIMNRENRAKHKGMIAMLEQSCTIC